MSKKPPYFYTMLNSILKAHNKCLTSGSLLLLFFFLIRACSHKEQALPHLLGKQGPRCHISPPSTLTETNLERLCSLPHFSAKVHSYARRDLHNPHTQVKQFQKLKLPLSQQLPFGFNKNWVFFSYEKAQLSKQREMNKNAVETVVFWRTLFFYTLNHI